jgi:hypothetical protein
VRPRTLIDACSLVVGHEEVVSADVALGDGKAKVKAAETLLRRGKKTL